MKNEALNDRKSIGKQGEEIAASYLKGLKYRVVEKNYRCRCGEIDIVALDGNTLVFIEVKTRRTVSYGPPQLSVTPFKQRQISKAALTYLAKNRQTEMNARFDVISIILRDERSVLDHIKDAFELAF
jgi:putative endonuclease